LKALNLELVMGITPRGSYCRDLLEMSRLIDLYANLGVPLQLTLAYPSAPGPDPKGNPELRTAAGHWKAGINGEMQADWAATAVALAAAKPSVHGIFWAHWSDSDVHHFPHCGLLDHLGKPRPALERLLSLRKS
jgi:hypothetical protein